MKTTRQMIRVGLAPLGDEGDPADYPELDFYPPESVRREAEHGLSLRLYAEEALGRKRPGGTSVGVTRAVQLADGHELGPRSVKRMKAYFSRHQVDKRAARFGDDDDPSPGYVAWELWGGDAGWTWAAQMVEEMRRIDGRR